MLSTFHATLHPEMYHGHGKKPPFFEGWYYKLVSADRSRRFAIIPGIIKGENGHAFVQVLDGMTGLSGYYSFPLQEFQASARVFEVQIGQNWFSQYGLGLDLAAEQGQISGQLHFEGLTPWPVTWRSPGIMGWYAWVPRMECYHGVVSLDHVLRGSLNMCGEELDFSQGRGYIEKDWGASFPSAWVWFQTNHFSRPGICLTASVAMIPWLGSAFRGFIIGFWWNQTLYRLATYTGARIDKLEVGDHHVDWVVSDRRFRLEMLARRAGSGLLLGPTRTEMGKRVAETLNATVEVRLAGLDGQVLFQDRGEVAGLEVNGDLDRLQHA